MAIADDIEIAKLRSELQEIRDKAFAEEFANKLGERIMITLAFIPLNRWPEWARNHYHSLCQTMPSQGYVYKERLPKSND